MLSSQANSCFRTLLDSSFKCDEWEVWDRTGTLFWLWPSGVHFLRPQKSQYFIFFVLLHEQINVTSVSTLKKIKLWVNDFLIEPTKLFLQKCLSEVSAGSPPPKKATTRHFREQALMHTTSSREKSTHEVQNIQSYSFCSLLLNGSS